MSYSRNRFWPKVGKGAFLLIGLYAIVMSFWCSHVGHAFRRNQLARDHRYHTAIHELEEQHGKLAKEVAEPQSDPRFIQANNELTALSNSILLESQADFKGTDALRWTGIGGVALLCIYFGIAGVAWRRLRHSGHLAQTAIEKA